jgi:recombinational DNA repair protein RecR
MSQSVEALENQYFLLRSSLSTLTDQGATTNQLDQLRAQIAQSRTNFLTAVTKNLHDDNPQIAELVTQLNAGETNLKTTIDHLGDVAKVIDAITKAVDIGSQIVAKAVAL